MKPKPDCTGQRFGKLVVLVKGNKRATKRESIQLWELQCDCGNIIELPRGYFDRREGGQISCGCKRRLGEVDNNRRPLDIVGQKFGQLTAIRLTGRKHDTKPTWLLQCECGGICEMSLSRIRAYQRTGIRLNCRDKTKHFDHYLEYPATPNPYPKDAGELVVKYLHLTELPYQLVNNAVEDAKRDRLLRAAWILTYRRQQGEKISELYEKRFISKHLRYCSIDVFRRRNLDSMGGFLFTIDNRKKQIGDKMTNTTSQDYPVIETPGKLTLSKISEQVRTKRFKFKRC